MMWLLTNWKIIACTAGVVSVLGLIAWFQHKAYTHGYDTCGSEYSAKQDEENAKIITKKKVVKHETQSLDRAGLVKQLCDAGWVRESAGCPK